MEMDTRAKARAYQGHDPFQGPDCKMPNLQQIRSPKGDLARLPARHPPRGPLYGSMDVHNTFWASCSVGL